VTSEVRISYIYMRTFLSAWVAFSTRDLTSSLCNQCQVRDDASNLKQKTRILLLLLVCIRYRGNVSTEPFPSNDKRIFTEPLPSNDRGIHTHRLMGGIFLIRPLR
jgi:hypothetical protein